MNPPAAPKVAHQVTVGMSADGLVFVGGNPPPVRAHLLMMLKEAEHHFTNEFYKNQPVAPRRGPAIEVAPAGFLTK